MSTRKGYTFTYSIAGFVLAADGGELASRALAASGLVFAMNRE